MIKATKKYLILLIAIFACIAQPSFASPVTYDYVGKPLDYLYPGSGSLFDGRHNIVGFVTFANPLTTGYAQLHNIVDFSFTDGITTVDRNLDTILLGATSFAFSFVDGEITGWSANLITLVGIEPFVGITLSNPGDLNKYDIQYETSGVTDQTILGFNMTDSDNSEVYYKANNNAPGTWTLRNNEISAVPEPEINAMMLLGLGMLGGVIRRKFYS